MDETTSDLTGRWVLIEEHRGLPKGTAFRVSRLPPERAPYVYGCVSDAGVRFELGKYVENVARRESSPAPAAPVQPEGRFPPKAGDVWERRVNGCKWTFTGDSHNGYFRANYAGAPGGPGTLAHIEAPDDEVKFRANWTFVRSSTPAVQPAAVATGYHIRFLRDYGERCRAGLVYPVTPPEHTGSMEKLTFPDGVTLAYGVKYLIEEGYAERISNDPKPTPSPAQSHALGYIPGRVRSYDELLREARVADGVDMTPVGVRVDLYHEHRWSLIAQGLESIATYDGIARPRVKAIEPWRSSVDEADCLCVDVRERR